MQIGQEMQITRDPPRGTCILLALESFRGNARNNQPLHYLQQSQSAWPLTILLMKRFDLEDCQFHEWLLCGLSLLPFHIQGLFWSADQHHLK